MFHDYLIAKNFALPEGFLGKISTKTMNVMNQKQYHFLYQAFFRSKPQTCLDIGFGNGHVLKQLHSLNPTTQFWGIELSQDMVSYTTKKFTHQSLGDRIQLKQGNINDLPYDNNYFDLIYSINTLYFWDDLEHSYQEVNRVLKSNGLFINLFYSKKWLDRLPTTKKGFSKYTPDEIYARVQGMDFNSVKLVPLKNDLIYALIVKK